MNQPKRIVHPPLWLAIGVAAIFLLGEFLPVASFDGGFADGLGSFAILLGLLLMAHTGGMFRLADNDLKPFAGVNRLLTGGPYRFSRNPMYFGMALVLLGTAVTVGALSALFVAPLFVLIVHYRFVRHEEAMLRERFGEQYENYCRIVRRWF